MGTLSIVSTPIGNLEDITVRALTTLFSVDVIVCEDTRRTGQLLELLQKKYAGKFNLEKKPQLLSYYDQKELRITPELIGLLEHGKNIALVSDAGTPGISDPGYRIISECVKRGIPTIVIPGASALLTALSGSGLPTNTFTFLGYLPEKQEKRKKILETLKTVQTTTYVCYCAPHKLIKTLMDIEEILGNIGIVVARELTKVHEEFFRGSIDEALVYFQNPKGEFVLLFTIS